MTGTEIKSLAESYLDGESIDNSVALLWLNEWLSDIGPDCGKLGTLDLTVTDATQWFDLPSDYVDMDSIDCNGIHSGVSYEVRDSKIRLGYEGAFRVYYRRMPASMLYITAVPDCDGVLHGSGAMFLAMRYKVMEADDENNPYANRLSNEYQHVKELAVARLSRRSAPSQIKMAYSMEG